jgi:competence protein ComGC
MLIVVLLLGVPGCQKSADSTSPKGNGSEQSSAAPDLTAVLNELTQVLRKYALENRGLPKTFAELVAAGYVKSPPPPPPGKKFEIDFKTSRVVLVNQ